MAEKKLHGVVVLYVNMYPDLGQDIEVTMKMVKEMNKPLVDRLDEDGRYVVLFIPTTKEATRIEKVDYNAPYPRYMAKSADVSKVGLGDSKKKHNMFKEKAEEEEEEREWVGILSLFINFHPDIKLDPQETLLMIRALNEGAIKVITEDGRYQLILVPTTKEASRIEKVDYDMPFPRLMPKAVEKAKVVPAPFRPEKDEEPEDEPDDDDIKDEEE